MHTNPPKCDEIILKILKMNLNRLKVVIGEEIKGRGLFLLHRRPHFLARPFSRNVNEYARTNISTQNIMSINMV